MKFYNVKLFYTLFLFTAFAFAQNSTETYKEHHLNGELKIIGEIIDLKSWGKSKIGDWKFFDEKGVLTEIYTFHPFKQEFPAQIKKFDNGELISHIIYDISRYREFEFDVLNKIYTSFEKDKYSSDDIRGKVLAKIDIKLNNEKLEKLNKALSESMKNSIADFKAIIDSALFADYKFIINYYDDTIYLGYKNYITGDTSIYYKEYKKGQVKEEGNCLNGEVTTYHQNGQIKEIGKYKEHSPTGVWKEYDEKGKLINKERW